LIEVSVFVLYPVVSIVSNMIIITTWHTLTHV
jgi:hypothetical protein